MQVKLKDVCTVITDGSHSSPIGIKKGYPMLSVKDMRSMGFDYSDCKFISKKDYDILVRNGCKPQINDVLIAKDGSYLKEVFVVKEDIDQVILSSIAILRPDTTKINPYFLMFYLQTESVKEIVANKYVSGSALQRIILKNFKEIEIELPDRPIQDKIVEILSNIDNQIERNNEMTKRLQVLAQSTYSRWFNQFEFPNEDGLPYKSNGGKFEYNEELKREIPIGWEVKELGGKNGITKCVLGGTPSRNKEKYWNGNINWINSGEVANFPITDTIEKITQEGLDNSATELMNKGSIIISITGNIRTSINAIDCCANQSVVGVYEKDNFLNSYLYFLIKENEQFYIKQMTGAVQKHINKEVVEKTKVLIPSETILIKYNQIVCHIIKQIISISMEAQELNSLKSRLLPLLINGQLEV